MSIDFVFSMEELQAAEDEMKAEEPCDHARFFEKVGIELTQEQLSQPLTIRWPSGHRSIKSLSLVFNETSKCIHLDVVEGNFYHGVWRDLLEFAKENGYREFYLDDHCDRDVWGRYGFSGKHGDDLRRLSVEKAYLDLVEKGVL